MVSAGRHLMTAARALAILSALLPVACVIPFAGPPARLDFGAAHAFRDDEQTAFHFAIGLHTASLGPEVIPKSDLFDVGLGFTVDAEHGGTRAKGFYGSGEWFVLRRKFFRMGAGLRGEYLFTGPNWGSGAYARVSSEFFAAGTGNGAADSQGGDGCGTALLAWRGVPATGVYVESGAQALPDGRQAFVATAGVSLRLPALAGLLIFFPGCH
jgi:hypothetical protein